MWAMRIQACALAIDLSQSFDRRRQRPSPAKVRSTTHRRGSTSKPCAVSERLTICTVKRSDDLQGVSQFGARIAAVRKDMPQHGIARGDSLQHIQRAVKILNAGAMDLEPYAQSGRIGTNVALAALDLFSGVISSNPATFCGFYTLTIGDPGCGMGVSALSKGAVLSNSRFISSSKPSLRQA